MFELSADVLDLKICCTSLCRLFVFSKMIPNGNKQRNNFDFVEL